MIITAFTNDLNKGCAIRLPDAAYLQHRIGEGGRGTLLALDGVGGRPESREAEDPRNRRRRLERILRLRFCVGRFSRLCRERRYATNLKKLGTRDGERPRHVAYL